MAASHVKTSSHIAAENNEYQYQRRGTVSGSRGLGWEADAAAGCGQRWVATERGAGNLRIEYWASRCAIGAHSIGNSSTATVLNKASHLGQRVFRAREC